MAKSFINRQDSFYFEKKSVVTTFCVLKNGPITSKRQVKVPSGSL